MDSKTQARIDTYLAEADFFKTATKAKLVRELKSLGYTATELDSAEKISEAAKVERTARLHRARAVRSSAKRSGRKAA